ncbi:MAG: hypothetical protein FJ280_10920 [Planctomycetes bacterium]|nr:hypothetical protein [Planctomycetota bacterium]
MKSKGRSPRTGSWERSGQDAFSGEWFIRYLLDAVLLAILMLMAVGVALYLDAGDYLGDWNQELGAGLLVCLLLCPMLAVVTLALVIYAGIRVFLRPRTWGHALVRLTFLLAHVVVLLVCLDTISSTTTALVGSFRQSSARLDPTVAWRGLEGRDLSGPPSGAHDGPPDGSSFSPPSGMGVPGLLPGGGAGPR